MHRVAITVSMVLRTVTPRWRSVRKFFAAWTAISCPPNSTTTNEVAFPGVVEVGFAGEALQNLRRINHRWPKFVAQQTVEFLGLRRDGSLK